MNILVRLLIVMVFTGSLIYAYNLNLNRIIPAELKASSVNSDLPKDSQKFLSSGLRTNTDKTSIELSDILWWGPEKDGIPAINNPKFLSIATATKDLNFLTNNSRGISVEQWDEAKFYPYNILVWHEIVNDTIWDNSNIAVTFCPLCGTAIVYDRLNWDEELRFGVSWKLYQSNLLMYDTKTESLWSQSLWKAVVGDKLWESLNYVQSNMMSFSDFTTTYPEGIVLSDDTGFRRNYSQIPYWDYDESDTLLFPVKNTDASYHKKELFYIVNLDELSESIAFLFKDLREEKEASIEVRETIYTATYDGWVVEVKNDNTLIPGYYEMWFSWVTHNPSLKNLWSKS